MSEQNEATLTTPIFLLDLKCLSVSGREALSLMVEKDWIYVMDDASLPEGSMAPVYPLGINVLMTRVNGSVYAVEGKCAHMGCPLFCGTLADHILTCPCHDWRFNIQTGEFIDAVELRLKVYQTRAENGKLYVSLVWKEER